MLLESSPKNSGAKTMMLKRQTLAGKGLSATFMLYLRQVKICQLTVHSLKLEKSEDKHQKSRLKKKQKQAQKTGLAETTKNA
jgi:hypothetical protein